MEILLVTMDWTSVGEESHACRFFHTGWSGGTAGGRRRVWQAFVSTHGEEKIWRRMGFLQVWGTVHNKSSCMPG